MRTELLNDNLKILVRLVPYLWPENFAVRIRVVLSLFFLILAKISTVTTPIVMIWLVDSINNNNEVNDHATLFGIGAIGLIVAYGLIRVFSVSFNQLRDGIFAMVGQRALRQLALKTFSHIHKLSLSFHLERKTGALNRIIDRGVKGVDFLLRFFLFSIFPLTLELIFVATILIIRYDWRYVFFVFITLFIYFWFTFKVTNWRLKIRRKMNERDADAAQRAMDSLINYETVKYFDAEQKEHDRFDESMKEYEVAAIKTGVSLAFLNFGQSAVITLGLVSVMLLAANEVFLGNLTVGEFVGINAIMVQLVMPLNFLGTVYREIRQSLVDMSEMFGILDQDISVKDAPGCAELDVKEGVISFSHVNFSYNEKKKILTDLSFKVESGQTLAIVGASGSGKSTIARLLFRFYDINSGSITIDYQDLRDVSQSSLRSKVGVVPQDTVLFNDTIRYNIEYGRPGASFDDVLQAAKEAHIDNFIQTLPEGYNTLVGERGLKLSGGEKQRIGIARTFLKNPPILVLDEATSALDSETEKEILKSLKAVGKGRTVITIAHRLSTISHSDIILVIKNGKIIEKGSHYDLIKLKSNYYRIWSQQQFERKSVLS